MPEAMTARDIAVNVLDRWQKGEGRPEQLLKDALNKSRLDQRDRGLAMELSYGVIRNLINLDFVLSRFIKEPPKGVSMEVRDILRVAAYQSIFLDKIPPHAAVYEAVEQAKKTGKGTDRFVNGVLRSLIRGFKDVIYPKSEADPVQYLSVRHSYPEWLVKRWIDRLGYDEAAALMEAGNFVPPLTLRANTLKTDRAGLMAVLVNAGVGCTETGYAPDGIIIKGYPPVHELPGYAEGLFAVQDEAAQLVSLLLSPSAGGRLLDACAAPGGKACHMAALSGGKADILALDISLDKIRLMKENITRLGAGSVVTLKADASKPLQLEGGFDGILLDAPCSALGVIRRRPEVKYTRREEDIPRLAALQAAMLGNLAPLVKPGGSLVFAACTTEPEEGEHLIQGFLAANRGFVLDDPSGLLPERARALVTGPGYLRTYPHRHGTDGFFAARILRRG